MSRGERRYSGAELRAEGRTLSGPVVRYHEISPGHREKFLPGSLPLSPTETIQLDYRHDQYRTLTWTGAGLVLEDTPEALLARAEIPATPVGDLALAEVREGKLTGFSVEFHARQESRESGIRVIERADLVGVGVVAKPSYPGSVVELRRRSGRTIKTRIPRGRRLACDCRGDAACRFAKFQGEAIEEMWTELTEKFQRESGIVAVHENYTGALGSTQRGTVRLTKPTDAGLGVEIDLPDSDAGRAVIAASDDAGIIVRPFIDSQRAVAVQESIPDSDELVMVYTKAPIRALIVSSTNRREGWPEPTIVPTPEIPETEPREQRRRRFWL